RRPNQLDARARRPIVERMMMMLARLAWVVGDTTADRWVIAATWVGLIALAAVVMIVSAQPPRLRR
ncbi:MAG: hypothetical protein ACXVDD_17330, partial [Polyangia bacterium]